MSEVIEPKITIKYGNILYVNGEFMRAKEVNPERFKQILILAKFTIVSAIGTLYEKQTKNNPGQFIQRASVFLANLSEYQSETLSATAIESLESVQTDDVVSNDAFRQKEDIAETWHPYWDAIESADLFPIARRALGSLLGGWCLAASDMPFDERKL